MRVFWISLAAIVALAAIALVAYQEPERDVHILPSERVETDREVLRDSLGEGVRESSEGRLDIDADFNSAPEGFGTDSESAVDTRESADTEL